MPIFRRLPKRGFSNVKFATPVVIVNVGSLDSSFEDGETVNLESLRKTRLVQTRGARVKVLAGGTIGKKLTVEAHAFSEKARQAIEGAGGTARLIEVASPQEAAKAKRNTAKGRKNTSKGKAKKAEEGAPQASAEPQS